MHEPMRLKHLQCLVLMSQYADQRVIVRLDPPHVYASVWYGRLVQPCAVGALVLFNLVLLAPVLVNLVLVVV